MGLDISRDAEQSSYNTESVAQNQEAFKLENRSEFHESDMFSYLEHHNELFDVIVSNPPYIRLEDKKILSPMYLTSLILHRLAGRRWT
ncbi:MAG: Eco57I restriction-modification methylase domain-containing protein [Veillonella atypica]